MIPNEKPLWLLDPAHSHNLVEVSVPFIPSPFCIALHQQTRAAHPDLIIPLIRHRPLLLRCATPLPLNPAHLTSCRRLVPLPSVRVGPQWTPAAGHPLYKVRSVLGAPRTGDPSTAVRNASGGLLQGAAPCHGRLPTWRPIY
jgi:hypothetical protein